MKSSRLFLVTASTFGFLGVALGAFGAHSLKSSLSSEMLSVFETGVRYQMYHAFGLFVAALALQSRESRKIRTAGLLFVAGVILFSGSLYVLAITGILGLGIITPAGGVCFLAGWATMAWGFWERATTHAKDAET
jgi:uncharacterized membrane protein YgdD (TMEM256/DUF423 family)